MLSYNHIYHAGNHADALKHMIFFALLKSLSRKEKPFTVIDTHAGAGLYDLSDERAEKTGEARDGIFRLIESARTARYVPPLAREYIDFASRYVKKNFYPGSPEIARSLSRPCDSLVMCELHPAEVKALRANVKNDPRAHVHFRDGFEALESLTPPPVKRGLAFVDPSYEDAFEYGRAADALIKAHERWSAAALALWYPILEHRRIECGAMKQKITAAAKTSPGSPEVIDAFVVVRARRAASLADEKIPRLLGSGMLVVNPPWTLGETLRETLPFVARALGEPGAREWGVT